MSFVVDKEFRQLIPPLTPDERELLEASLLAEGCRDPLVVWRRKGESVLLDGHNRHEICTEHSLPYDTTSILFPDRDAAKAWIIRNQQARRNLTSSQRAALAVELEEIEAKRAKERQGTRTDLGQDIPQEVAGSSTGEAREKAARAMGTNRQYVSDAKKLRSEAPDLYAEVRDGEKSITKAKRDLKDRERERKREENRKLVQKADPPPKPAEGQRFQAIVIDPPWDWGDEGDVSQFGRGDPTYATMPLEKVAALPVPDLADADAHIYLWITNRSLPKGFSLLEGWGFRYITALTWVKPSIGMGNYFRGSTEHILFGVRGSLSLLRRDVATHFEAPRPGPHSAKPDEFYKLVESCSPGPWLDMFARKERPGWVTWGAEVASAS